MAGTRALVLEIRDLVPDPVDAPAFRDEVYVRAAINPTVREIFGETLGCRASATLYAVAGQAKYAWPAALGCVYYAERVEYDGRAIDCISKADAGDIEGTEPQYYAAADGGFELVPAPAAASAPIVLDVLAAPRAATEAAPITDELLLPDDVRDTLKNGAAAKMCTLKGDVPRAQIYLSAYKDGLRRLRQQRHLARGALRCRRDRSGIDAHYFRRR